MGNQTSRPAGGAHSSTAAGQPTNQGHVSRRSNNIRRDSIQPTSTETASGQPPLSSTPNASSHIPSRTFPTHSQHPQPPSAESSPSQRIRRDDKMGNTQSHQQWKEKQESRRQEREEEQSTPVTVPRPGDGRRQRGPDSQFEPSGPPRDPNYIPQSNLNFPPRLPLPIGEEVYTPGSPIISPQEFSEALQDLDPQGGVPRRSSILSSTTADDEDLDSEYQRYALDASKGRTVPTLVEWKQHGEKVYVTGTFASWSRKYRMHRDPITNILSTVLDLPPGTHHVKFIVDGDMQLSNELPTAVDYTNILVNYIEVSEDDIPKEKPKGPDPTIPDGVHPPQVLYPEAGVEAQDHEPNAVQDNQNEDDQSREPLYYGDTYPEYLLDLDRDENTNRFMRAANCVAEIPMPPTLPPFLGKSILNGTTPMKDDASVLIIPNHTVLNHLSTSSIKNDVLATALTTRYKRKAGCMRP